MWLLVIKRLVISEFKLMMWMRQYSIIYEFKGFSVYFYFTKRVYFFKPDLQQDCFGFKTT